MIKLLIVSNFFVTSHFVDGNSHIYDISGHVNGMEHRVTVISDKPLPVIYRKKFFAKVTADCVRISDTSSIPEMSTTYMLCMAERVEL